MKEIYIIRHGETDLNKQGIVQGKGVDASLNEKGIWQAQQFYKWYKNVGFNLICTSTLKRTHQTVQAFIDDGIEWKQFAELDEISWGKYEGQSVFKEFKTVYEHLIDSWHRGITTEKTDGGESPDEVSRRLRTFELENLQSKEDQKILICMHGRALRIFLPTLLHLPLSSMDEYPHQNVTLYKLKEEHGVYTIELFNNQNHLNESN